MLIFLGESEPLLKRESTIVFVLQKRAKGNWSPLSKYRGFGVYSINTTGGWRKMFITWENAVIWFLSYSAPSQASSLGLNFFMTTGLGHHCLAL